MNYRRLRNRFTPLTERYKTAYKCCQRRGKLKNMIIFVLANDIIAFFTATCTE